MQRAVSIVAVLGCVSALAGTAHAEGDKAACASAYETGQRLRNSGKLRASREQLVACSNACRGTFQRECVDWLVELDKAIPSIAVVARDATGADIIEARVRIDGVVVAERLDGRAIEVDPGAHTLRVEREGTAPIEQSLLVTEGERRRPIVIQFPAPARPEPPAHGEPRVPDRGADERRAAVPWTAWALGGLSVVGLTSFTYFGLRGRGDESDLGVCRPNCSQSSIDTVARTYLVADISLAVSVLAAGLAVVVVLTHSPSGGTRGLASF